MTIKVLETLAQLTSLTGRQRDTTPMERDILRLLLVNKREQ